MPGLNGVELCRRLREHPQTATVPVILLTAKGFDTDQSFLLAEINGDELFFNAIARSGAVVDSGVITRRK